MTRDPTFPDLPHFAEFYQQRHLTKCHRVKHLMRGKLSLPPKFSGAENGVFANRVQVPMLLMLTGNAFADIIVRTDFQNSQPQTIGRIQTSGA